MSAFTQTGETMNIVTKYISELKPYGNNPKIHTDSQIDKIAKSIRMQEHITMRHKAMK